MGRRAEFGCVCLSVCVVYTYLYILNTEAKGQTWPRGFSLASPIQCDYMSESFISEE